MTETTWKKEPAARWKLEAKAQECENESTRDFVTRYERRAILAAKRDGASEYVFVDWSSITGEGEKKGENMALRVQAEWPGAIHDPDKSNDKTWAFLLVPNDRVQAGEASPAPTGSAAACPEKGD